MAFDKSKDAVNLTRDNAERYVKDADWPVINQ